MLCVLSLVILFFVMGSRCDSRTAATDQSMYKNLKLFTEALDIIKRNYVENVDAGLLIQGAIEGMVKSLDPHSAYLTADMYKELQSETKGYFGGIGIEITIQNDLPTVVSPIEDTPAFVAGIKAGDQIVKIDDKPTKGISIMETVKRLRGPENSQVKLSIMRKNVNQIKEVVINRAIINVKSVKYRLIDTHIGYIRISTFAEKTAEDAQKALTEIMRQSGSLQGLVLDLRNNPGGLLEQSVKVADLFLKNGGIVSIRGKVKSQESTFSATNNGNEPACPMVVLVNEGSASASEIVSGALQDNGRAVILGTQTFGKASVQTVIPFENGSALKLTTAKYYTPNGRSIQAEGIKPDIVVEYVRPGGKEIETTIREKDLVGHIKGDEEKKNGKPSDVAPTAPAAPAVSAPPAKRDYDDVSKDNQLKNAVDLLKSWEIFKKKQAA